MSVSRLESTRGFKEGELDEFGIRAEGTAYAIPVPHRRGVWYERAYNPGGKPKYAGPKGEPAHLYNPLGLGPNADEVWIAEGEFDTLSLIVCGAPAVGIMGVGNFHRAWRHLFDSARVVLALDPDEAGRDATMKLLQTFPQAETFTIADGYTDVNDWLTKDRASLELAVTNF